MTTTPNPLDDLAEFQRRVAETQRSFQEMSEQFAQTLEAVLKIGSERDSHFLAGMIQALDVDRPEPGPDGQDRPQDQALSFGFD